MAGIGYDEFVGRLKEGDKLCEDMRQHAKCANFGFPGGLGAEGFLSYAKGYGLKLTLAQAKSLRDNWYKRWPEAHRYFRYISSITGDGEGTIEQLFSGRVRGGLRYTQAANSYFQGLAADGAKAALVRVTKECYVRGHWRKPGDRFVWAAGIPSPLFGCRPVIFMHDEIITEVRNDDSRPEIASEAAKRQQFLMVETMKEWLPDIPVKASPVLMRRWYKGAKPVHDAAGNLLPARPVKDERGNTRWVADTGDSGSGAAGEARAETQAAQVP